MTIHKLMIKTHNQTGLKYLCYTRKKDHENYTGSGLDWLAHLLTYGFDFNTELIFQTDNIEEFRKVAVQKSLEFDVVNSNEWANRKLEEGDGGDTVSNKRWITDGKIDKYIDKNAVLPENWIYGRSNCIFNDSDKQSEFSSRTDRVKAGKNIKKAWEDGKFDKRDLKGKLTGDLNPSKRPEQREKARQFQLSREPEFCNECQKWFKNLNVHLYRSNIHNDRKN